MVSVDGWPAVGSERCAWTPRIPSELVSARIRQRHTGDYRAALVPIIASRTPVLPSTVSSLAQDAAAEIARFDAELGGEVAPFASVLLRSESASSSMIEHLTAGARAIAVAELGGHEKRNATEIVGNVRAMTAALELADSLDEAAILSMHEALAGHLHPDIAGRWRTEQVWIGGTTFGPHQADFVPPQHHQVPGLVADLVTFMTRDDLPVVEQCAVAHAQFETIHPFVDGNGRTGRALIHALLRHHGLTNHVTVPVSAGLLTDTEAYFDALTAYREGDPVPIIERLARAAFTATTNGRQLVADLRSIRKSWDETVTARRGSAVWSLVDLLVRQPVIDAPSVATALGIEQRNTHRIIAPLIGAGILTEFTGMRRNRMWQAREVLTALDDFAARAGRRSSVRAATSDGPYG